MMNETRKNHVGGGGEGHLPCDFKVLLTVFSIFAVVVASGLVILSDSSDALTSDGTEHGTSDSPLTGLSGDVTDFDGTYYVAVGSPVEILGVVDFDTGFNHVITNVTEGFGLTLDEYGAGALVYKIVGSVSKAGEITINIMSEGSSGIDYRTFTLMAVDVLSGSGTEGDPFQVTSEDLVSDIVDFLDKYRSSFTDAYVYFEFESGSYVNFTAPSPDDGYFVIIDEGSLSGSGSPFAGTMVLSGIATEEFSMEVANIDVDFTYHFYFIPEIDFTSPDSVYGISGKSISYIATTNVLPTFTELGGTAASWLDIDPTTGQISGTFPTVDSETTFTYEIQAAYVIYQSNTATLTLTITVIPALEFLSDPAEGVVASIGFQTQSEYHPMQARE